MHQEQVAHRYVLGVAPFQKEIHVENCFRDCTMNSIMLGPSGMYPEGYHPVQLNRSLDFKGRAKQYTRTERPPRYYLIDFGLSRQYPSRDALDDPLRRGDKAAPEHGGEKPAPEHRLRERCNPFRTDIYDLGNIIRTHFMQVRLD